MKKAIANSSNLTLPGRESFWKYVKKNPVLYIMLAPVMLHIVLFCYVPMGGIVVGFMNFKVTQTYLENIRNNWVGFFHFEVLFTSPDFSRIMYNTIGISLLRFIFGFPAPIILALLLNEIRNSKFKRTVQTISYMPFFLSWVILAGLIISFLQLDGALNAFLGLFGLEPQMFLYNRSLFWPILIITGIWSGIGFGTIIYLAGLSGVDVNLYEAAVIDGANRWQQTWHISLSSLKQTIVILLILNAGNILNAGFEQIMLLKNEMVNSVAEVIDTYVYYKAFQSGAFSFATAVGLFRSVTGLILVVGSNWIAKKFGDSSLF